MKKIFLLLTAIILTVTPVYAQDTKAPTKLTVQEATEKAIAYSHTLKELSENLDVSYDKYDNTVVTYNAATEGYNIMDLSTTLRQIRNQISGYKLSEQTEKISIGFSVKEFFADVIKAENDLDLFNQELEISNKELEIATLKLELGIISQSEYDSIYNSNKSLKKEISEKEAEVKNAYISLNTVMGTDLDEQYELDYTVEYEPYDDPGVDVTLNKALCVAQSLTSKEQAYELAEYQLENFTQLNNNSNNTRTSLKNQVSKAARDIEDAKNTIEQNVIKDHNSIIEAQNQYETGLSELSQLEDKLDITAMQYEMGRVTELDLKKAQYDVDSKKNDISDILYSYTLMKEKFNEPILY